MPKINPANIEVLHFDTLKAAKGNPLFDKVYELYERSFTLKEEQQAKEDFLGYLGNNVTKAKGGVEEAWVALRDKTTGDILGALNYNKLRGNADPAVAGSVHDIFLMTDAKHRRQGVSRMLLDESMAKTREFIGLEKGEKAIVPRIAEQNNMLLMTPNEYLADTESAGIDQVVRRVAFEGLDYRTAEARYLQAPPTPDMAVNEYLDLVVKLEDGQTISGKALADHTKRLFHGPSFDGVNLKKLPEVAATLEAMERIPTVKMRQEGGFKKLQDVINPETVAQLAADPAKADTRIGELLPRVSQKYFGDRVTEYDLPAAKQPYPYRQALLTSTAPVYGAHTLDVIAAAKAAPETPVPGRP